LTGLTLPARRRAGKINRILLFLSCKSSLLCINPVYQTSKAKYPNDRPARPPSSGAGGSKCKMLKDKRLVVRSLTYEEVLEFRYVIFRFDFSFLIDRIYHVHPVILSKKSFDIQFLDHQITIWIGCPHSRLSSVFSRLSPRHRRGEHYLAITTVVF
jgi:hypothetical protein